MALFVIRLWNLINRLVGWLVVRRLVKFARSVVSGAQLRRVECGFGGNTADDRVLSDGSKRSYIVGTVRLGVNAVGVVVGMEVVVPVLLIDCLGSNL